MKPPGGHRRRKRGSSPDLPPEIALRRFAVSLFDKGDGRAVDWPMVAATAFKVAFSCLDEAKGDDRAMKVLRKFEGGVYNRLAGNPDDGTAYTSEPAPSMPAGADMGMVPDHDFNP